MRVAKLVFLTHINQKRLYIAKIVRVAKPTYGKPGLIDRLYIAKIVRVAKPSTNLDGSASRLYIAKIVRVAKH